MSEKTELFQGPEPKWKPSAEDAAVIEKLLASDDELDNAYGEAYQAGCFVTEFGGGMTAVGTLDTIAAAEFRLGIEIDPTELCLGDCINLGAYPGSGATRAEAVRDGVRQVLEERH